MSFPVPQNAPSFSSAQRSQEDTHWRSRNRDAPTNGDARSRIASKVNEYLGDGKALPMYKDKPNPRGRGFFNGNTVLNMKRTYILLLFAVIAFFYWLRSMSISETPDQGRPVGSKGWRTKGAKNDVWETRRDAVKTAFITSWDGYEKYAWGQDEYHPISKTGRTFVEGGMGWIIVDALDTAIMMNLTAQVTHAREWIKTSLHYNANTEVNTFETTIRMLGGLLSAHWLSTTYPELAPLRDDDVNQPGEDLYIEKATDLADRLLGAYETASGVPDAGVNLNTSRGIPNKGDGGASSTAEAATLQLEMKYLAKLTGESHYWEKAEKIIEVIDRQHRPGGLLPIYIYPTTGQFRGENIRLGSRGDSYYEYLIKQYYQTSEAEPVYLEMWDEALEGIKRHLITSTTHAHLTIIGERPSGLSSPLSPKMDHLVCFLPGTIAFAVTGGQTVSQAKARLGDKWSAKHDEDLALAEELMKTCWGMYQVTATGLAPEITYFNIDTPPPTWPANTPLQSSEPINWKDADADWRTDYTIHANDAHNLQRPETVESLFYLHRITQNAQYREWGWEMFQSFERHARVYETDDLTAALTKMKTKPYGYTSLDSVMKIPAKQRDNMESFWLAETLKYFYLLFSNEDFFALDNVVVNTEAHFFPRFEMGRGLKTGWTREKVKATEEGSGAVHDQRHRDGNGQGEGKQGDSVVTVKVEGTP